MIRFVHLRSAASLALQLAILGALIAAFFVRMPQVFGPSMEPHITPGEYVLINTLAYKLSAPQRGDIIAFQHASDPPEIYIKRIIGLSGDRIRIVAGNVIVNGTPLPEPYLQFRDRRSFPEVVVPDHELYVLGDNRANSEDSRSFGPVPESDVTGRAIAGIWPIGNVGSL